MSQSSTDPEPRVRLITWPFVTAVVMLGVGAILAGPVTSYLRVSLVKKPIPLRAPLASLDETALFPYRVVRRERLEPTMIEELGTDEYIYWVLEDTSVDPASPLRVVTLFVTYYTGGSDLVPHTPDACYLGFGYQPAQAHENKEIVLPDGLAGESVVPVRILTFVKTAVHGGEQVSVVYTFRCNGEYVATREGVRRRVNNPLIEHAYFSKVEFSFPAATREQHLLNGGKLLERVLGVLERDHWPIWNESEKPTAVEEKKQAG
ncbi:MAG: hypothetical protein J5J06_04680 [Phycisphaerae bacterium]|nr:hypothetical protein [Phycisphaerae bacterium]